MKRILFLTLAGAALLTGCGLDDYEKRMDIERRRVRIFDEEEANLGGYLDAPEPRKITIGKEEKDIPAWPFDVYLRVPLGFERTAQNKTQYKLGDLFLYRYLRNLDAPNRDKPDETFKPGWSMFVACSKVGEINKAKETFKAGELSPEEFQRRILKVLREYYRLEYVKYGRDFDFPQTKPKEESLQPEFVIERVKEAIPPLKYESFEYIVPGEGKELTAFQLYFHRNGFNQIAIIFQVPDAMTKDPKFVRGRDYCLKSLDISEKAIEKKNEFVRSHRTVPKKT